MLRRIGLAGGVLLGSTEELVSWGVTRCGMDGAWSVSTVEAGVAVVVVVVGGMPRGRTVGLGRKSKLFRRGNITGGTFALGAADLGLTAGILGGSIFVFSYNSTVA